MVVQNPNRPYYYHSNGAQRLNAQFQDVVYIRGSEGIDMEGNRIPESERCDERSPDGVHTCRLRKGHTRAHQCCSVSLEKGKAVPRGACAVWPQGCTKEQWDTFPRK